MAFATTTSDSTYHQTERATAIVCAPTRRRRVWDFALENKAWWLVPAASVWSAFGLILLLG